MKRFWSTLLYPSPIVPAAIGGVIFCIIAEAIKLGLDIDHLAYVKSKAESIIFFASASLISIGGFWGMNVLVEREWQRPFRLIDHFGLCFFLYVIVLFTSNRLIIETEAYRHFIILGGAFVPAWWGIFVNLVYMMHQGFRKRA